MFSQYNVPAVLPLNTFIDVFPLGQDVFTHSAPLLAGPNEWLHIFLGLPLLIVPPRMEYSHHRL